MPNSRTQSAVTAGRAVCLVKAGLYWIQVCVRRSQVGRAPISSGRTAARALMVFPEDEREGQAFFVGGKLVQGLFPAFRQGAAQAVVPFRWPIRRGRCGR